MKTMAARVLSSVLKKIALPASDGGGFKPENWWESNKLLLYKFC